ncbi:G2/mitotic-specific cyclin A-like protein [Dinothrombium tinctorium]|uniref:G2/mitotic-specific cyclin A-like protein n=1 Tax=Dinothrombium tinctorium TaxID=1965070 RepID=A0A443QD75_9ACAR|nr:G2/mitotic-specific cyclin A-like protein [Dinothrombium tinctorium]
MSLSANKYDFSNPETYYQPPKDIPAHVEDFDRSLLNDTALEPHYAADVFNYYKEKELQYKSTKITDHYLMQEDGPKSRFQLLGVTAILIAYKI